MQDNWVDFKAIKAAVTMEMILGRYGVNWLRKKDDELRGRCPIDNFTLMFCGPAGSRV